MSQADGKEEDKGDQAIEIEFLTFEDVCEIHDEALKRFGHGQFGFLDEHTVRSAAAQPEAALLGQYLHSFPAGMAAAYIYYLTNQQGFLNGNKRAAVGSAIEFLARNGYRLMATNYDVYKMAISLAGENVQRDRKAILDELQTWFEERLAPMP
jgi:death-on-curing family protein